MLFLKSNKKVIILSLFAVIFILFVLGFLVKSRIGDLRPALFPAKKDIVKIIEKQTVGDEADFPLNLENGLKIGVFAKGLGAPRDLQFSQNEVLLVSIPSQGKVMALVDKDRDGKAEVVKEVLMGLNLPHGLAIYADKLFVAELTKVSRYSFDSENLVVTKEKVLFNLPARGGHSTRTLAIKNDGTLFVSLGSSCNVCIEASPFLAAVVISDTDGNNLRLFASGLRNSVFIKLNPKTGELWGTENSRDLLGDNIPADEINIISENKDYGWPYCFEDKLHDNKFDSVNEHSCSNTSAPIYKIQAHSAPLGLSFINSKQFPEDWQGDLLVAYHGSWNRSVPTGYKVVRLEVEGNKISGQQDFLTGFLNESNALGRPVDLEFDSVGSLYISDDKSGAIYKVVKK